MPNEWLTTPEAAQLTRYSADHVRRLVLTGKIKGHKRGRDWLVSRADLLNYVRNVEKLGAKRGPKPGT